MRFLLLLVVIALSSCAQKFYIVRHAEKAVPKPDTENMFDVSNPPLSEAGKARAQLLKNKLSGKKIRHIFSTKYARNIETATPLANSEKLTIELYSPQPDSLESTLNRLRSIEKGNVLVIGHSNTVDDLINKLTQADQLSDLPETAYDNLYILTRRKGKFTFRAEKFGDPGGADKK